MIGCQSKTATLFRGSVYLPSGSCLPLFILLCLSTILICSLSCHIVERVNSLDYYNQMINPQLLSPAQNMMWDEATLKIQHPHRPGIVS
jgi:hypothetical protein